MQKTPERRKAAADLMPESHSDLRILKARSEQLAKKNLIENEKIEEISYICFRLGKNERYGIPYSLAKEVLQDFSVTRLPHVPDYIAGIINWRGALITLLDLKFWFKLPVSKTDRNEFIIVIESDNLTVGVVADRIEGSKTCVQSTLDMPLPDGVSINSKYIYGLHKGTIAIINMKELLHDVKLQLKTEK